MPRRASLLPLLALVLAGCGGAVGDLLATVPPPVEFAGRRTGGVAALPVAGAYGGTLTVARVTYRYAENEDGVGEWSLVRSVPLEGSGDAEATVGADGSIALRRAGEGTPLFSGALQVSDDVDAADRTTAALVAADGTSALYPYVLRNGAPPTLTLRLHGRKSATATQATFVESWFELSPE